MLNRFQFHNHPVVNDQIYAIAAINSGALILNRQGHLGPVWNTR